MKLLLCISCFDVFKLDYDLRKCKCGKVYGNYDQNGSTAVTTDNEYTVNLALGNGSVLKSIGDMKAFQKATDNKGRREDYYELGNGKIEYAWVRPNNGPGNPHTKNIDAS